MSSGRQPCHLLSELRPGETLVRHTRAVETRHIPCMINRTDSPRTWLGARGGGATRSAVFAVFGLHGAWTQARPLRALCSYFCVCVLMVSLSRRSEV